MKPIKMDFLKMFTSKKGKNPGSPQGESTDAKKDKYTKDEYIKVLEQKNAKLTKLLDISEAQKEHLKQQIQEYKARELNNITKKT